MKTLISQIFRNFFYTLCIIAFLFTLAINSNAESKKPKVSQTSKIDTISSIRPSGDLIPNNPPTFQGGGKENFKKWAEENIDYSKVEFNDSIERNTVIRFIVEKDGSVSMVEIISSSGSKGLDKSAIEVVEKSPKWEPAITNGKPVRILVQVPIDFKK